MSAARRPQAAEPDAPLAASIEPSPWAAALARYASCASWDDRGDVVIEHRLADGTTTRADYWFTTAFERPDRLRFEWGQRTDGFERGREVVLHEAGVARSWPAGATEPWRCTSLEAALAEDAGGAAPRIAALLLPERFAASGTLSMVRDADARREPLDGVDCWRIELAGGALPAVAWLEAETLALRRLEERGVLGGVERRITSRWTGRFDAPLLDEAFALVAPAAEQRLGLLGALERASAWGLSVAFGVAALALVASLLLRRRRAT